MRSTTRLVFRTGLLGLLASALSWPADAAAQRTMKPVLHGRHWIAITGKPLGATAGAGVFQRGGNAVDAAAAMLAATATMFDVLSWGGETQALIYNPHTGKVIGINALGVAPTGATPEFFRERGLDYPPGSGPLAAPTPGTPGGLLVMLAEYGTLSLAEVLAPAMQLAEGYPIDAQTANSMERNKEQLKGWRYSREVFLPHLGEEREAPYPGEIFRQPDLLATLGKLVEAEQQALAAGKSRKEAIYAAFDRFYRGDIAEEFVRGSQEEGGLHTLEDLANWEVYTEEPVMTDYKGIEVYKLTSWVQGPVLLQALNILENVDLQSMGYNSAQYIHTLYQAMNLAFADRDFYYGDPYVEPVEPIQGLLSKEYARQRFEQINWERNDPEVKPGDPYPFEGRTNPYLHLLENWNVVAPTTSDRSASAQDDTYEEDFYAGTTSVQAADAEGWVVSITPSGGWIPATIAGRTGIGMSQRMQSFVLDERENPFNVVAPGKRPRATLTPSIALKDGKPFLSFAVQGGDAQDQNLLQFFLNVVEFDMNVQQAAEAANINSNQMRSSFGDHSSRPGQMTIHESVPAWVRAELEDKGYVLNTRPITSGPINAIFFDRAHGTMWGGSSYHGEDYGIAW
ncbi:MAG: gamma-glutamyltransferase [Gemmatimonadetes bacterium]|nr:gamma-glutamyltransferase [Gemmatimonadota bacterium]